MNTDGLTQGIARHQPVSLDRHRLRGSTEMIFDAADGLSFDALERRKFSEILLVACERLYDLECVLEAALKCIQDASVVRGTAGPARGVVADEFRALGIGNEVSSEVSDVQLLSQVLANVRTLQEALGGMLCEATLLNPFMPSHLLNIASRATTYLAAFALDPARSPSSPPPGDAM